MSRATKCAVGGALFVACGSALAGIVPALSLGALALGVALICAALYLDTV